MPLNRDGEERRAGVDGEELTEAGEDSPKRGCSFVTQQPAYRMKVCMLISVTSAMYVCLKLMVFVKKPANVCLRERTRAKLHDGLKRTESKKA